MQKDSQTHQLVSLYDFNINNKLRTAADLNLGEKAIIKDVDNDHPSSHRILEVGFTPGQEIELVNKSFFNDPIAFSIRGTIVAIRKNEAICIKI